MRRNLALAIFASTAFIGGLLFQNAIAAPVQGSIGFHGYGTMSQVGGSSGSSTVTFNNPMTVDIRTGDYSGISAGTPANLAPISWIGSGNNVFLTSSNTPEWTITVAGTVYQYSIISLLHASMNIAAGTVSLAGQGVITISGAINRDPTFITFSVQGTGTQFTFEMIQSSFGVPMRPVPEGSSTIALLGVGLAGLRLLCSRFLPRPN